jgi:hypothetical protein
MREHSGALRDVPARYANIPALGHIRASAHPGQSGLRA